jgi:predicted TIM-barrel fold metal-dependent hydrolase
MRLAVLWTMAACVVLGQVPPPILDVHMHAEPVDHFGPLGLKACPGDVSKNWPAANPGLLSVKTDDLEDCPNPIYAKKTDAEVFETTKRLIEKYNITGVVSGPADYVQRWRAALGDRIIPGIFVTRPGDPAIERLQSMMADKSVRVMGEVLTQYQGIAPADPALEPYWKAAEDNDVPVGIHMGPGPPGGVDYWKQAKYRVGLTDPALLEEVLVRHPKLRVYVMHAGWPMADRMIQMLYTYPRLYVDTAVIDWYLPRKEFHQYLKRLVDAGFASRILFGSDQMIWPEAIEVAIQSIESAEFLTSQQKRDIFYNNAVRFLGIQTPENVRTFWDKNFSGVRTYRVSPDASPLMLEFIAGRKSGAALDLGMGEGRNTIYLAEHGWAATGVDISPVAVGHAKKAAAQRGVKIEAIAQDLDAYDFGKDRWDLITSFYMQDWHANSKSDIPARIFDALRPGGLVIIEGFGPPRLRADQLAKGFTHMKILRNETVTAEPEWGKGQQRTIVRFVAEKMP